MLKLKYLFENYDLAKHCLAQYDYDAASLSDMMGHFRISSNAIYPFRNGTNPAQIQFLRLSPVEEKPFSSVVSEIHLIQWLIDNGYPAMQPIRMKNGKWADQADTEWGCYNVSCFARVPGKALDDIDGSLAIVRGYGRSLGTLHQTLKRYPAAEERRDHRTLLDEIRTRFAAYGAPAMMQAELNRVEAQLSDLPVRADNYGIVHYDFEPDNVFYDEATDLFSAIDFDDAMRCWFSVDIVRALDELGEVTTEADPEEAKRTFLEGYRTACPLTPADEATLPLMRRLVRLRQYSTLLHVMSEPTDAEPDWLVKLKELLTSRLRWMESTIAI